MSCCYSPCQVLGHEIISDLSVATGLSVPPSTNSALLQCQTSYVNFWLDGTDPVPGSGMVLRPYDAPVQICGTGIVNARFIRRSTSTYPTLSVTYLKYTEVAGS